LPPKPRPLSELEAVPNVCGDLIVKLEPDGSLRLNIEKLSGLSNSNDLFARLRQIFSERVKNAVFAGRFADRQDLPDEERIYKRVVVAAPSSAKYGDVLRIIDTVKASGTDDIWLQIDGEDYTWLIFEAVKPSR
jgi:biopolymer transport protein ExbD